MFNWSHCSHIRDKVFCVRSPPSQSLTGILEAGQIWREALTCVVQPTAFLFLTVWVSYQQKTFKRKLHTEMALLNYPVPDLDATLQEVDRVLRLILSPDLYSDYRSTVQEQRELLQESHKKFETYVGKQENWVTENFKRNLLSCCDPLPSSTALPFILLPTQVEQCTQLWRAAALLWSAAKLHCEPTLLEGSTSLERTQQSQLFAASRIPGKDNDEIKVYPKSIHAIIISVGGMFPVDILHRSSTSGKVSPRSFHDIYNQLSRVMEQPRAEEQHDPSAICSLSAMERKAWAASREDILKRGGEAAASLELMESALLTLCLEDCSAPPDLADFLDALKLGGGSRSRCLRYYDKVVNLVVFNDSKAGMVFEHSAVDGMVACLVAHCIHSLSEAADPKPVISESEIFNGHAEVNSVHSVYPAPLVFPSGSLKVQKPSTMMSVSQRVVSLEVSTYPDAFSALRGQRGLFDAWVNFSLQLSLREILGESAANHLLLVTPTHTRHYKHGRCDPTYSVTSHSRKLVDALASCIGPDNGVQYTTDLLQQFHFAFVEHKSLIKNTKRGQGIGPHIAALRQTLPSDNPLKKYLDNFRCPPVYITGTDVMEPVECLVGNVYAPNQLAVGYLWKKDRVCIMLNGNGSFLLTLEKLQKSLKKNLMLVMLLAVRYVIACEMGALECILKQSKTSKVNSMSDYCPEKQHNDSTSGMSTDYTLIIHGGAGKDMQLNAEETRLVEFALQIALTVGSEVLEKDGSSLDAVQRSVEAMENCFLFNAGKGSVFNKDGKHELEATIVDGYTNSSGSVACLQSVKNPIKAARCVMEKSQHSLIVGDGAEEFLQGLEEKEEPVGPEYFFTDIRYKELKARLSQPAKAKNNHPQTVGALALDRGGKLAAASSTGGIVGKLKGRVGDTAVVGAGIYADDKVAITCSGDGDVFLRQTVAQKIASLYHHKGISLRQACREVMTDTLDGTVAGIIAVDPKGEAIIEVNCGAMFVGSVVNGISHAEVLRPNKSFSDVIWETEELVAYLDPKPWTPGSSILMKKTLGGASSIFQMNLPDFMSMLEGARAVSDLLCEKLGVLRCALVFFPRLEESAQIKILPLHGLKPKWEPQLSKEEEFNTYNPGYCTSKSGPQWDADAMAKIQGRIRDRLPIPNAPSCFDYFGDSSDNSLFSQIVRGEVEQWRVWEDSEHVAFLTPYPNSPGLTVVVPRKMLSSDIFKLEESDYKALIQAIYEVAQLLTDGMRAQGVALIFEGFEIDYAHAKLIPLLPSPSGKVATQVRPEYFQTYPGYVSSVDGPMANPEDIKEIHSKITQSKPPRSWKDPQSHATLAIKSAWYRNLFQIQNTLFHSTVEYFHSLCQYAYALTPLTTDTISSPMGLGSDSEPVSVNLLGQNVYLADSMQFVLEYFLRFQDNLPGVYYISPSFRGEDPDSTHLNQFYHVECEVLGGMDLAMSIAEGYLAQLTKAMLKKHSAIILSTAGTLEHVTSMLSLLNGKKAVPRIPLDQAILMMPSDDCFEWVEDGQPQFGRKLTRKGERFLIEKCGGLVWLTEMDHLGVPFYQAYVEGTAQSKAKAADLLFGLGETVGLGERHSTPEMVVEALQQHEVPVNSYRWYIDMRKVKPLQTSGWGMGTERYLCWLLQHDDIRDIVIIPRMKGIKYMP